MLKKLFFLVSIITVIILFENCCKDQPRFFRRKGMSITKNPNSTIILDTAELLRLSVIFDIDYLAESKYHFSDFFIGNAYALRCSAAGEGGSQESITSVVITSNADFDSVHTSGSDITKYFYHPPFKDSIPLYLISSNESFDLLLSKKPTADSAHIFKVEVLLSNGDHFTAHSPNIIFKKK